MSVSNDPAAGLFYSAACNGDLQEAERVRAANPNVTVRSLQAAAIYGDETGLDELLAEEGAVNAGDAPLFALATSHYATEAGGRAEALVRVAKRLLAAGADPTFAIPGNDVPGGGRTVLSGAAGWTGSIEVCRALLDAGVPADDEVSLAVAVGGDHFDCAQLLVDRGARVNSPDAPLHWVLDVSYTLPRVQWLLERGSDPNHRVGELRESALHVAVRRRRVQPLEALLGAGAEPGAETTGGMSAYRHALRRQFTDVVTKLDELGANTPANTSDELAVALQTGQLERAAELIASDSGLARGTCPEETRLLPDLAGYARIESMRLLLDAGADITARALDGGTALHQAAWFGQPEAARFLIERGAPLDLRGDAHDCSPLGWVTHGSRFCGGAEERVDVYAELAEILLEAGAKLPGPDDEHDHHQHAMAAPQVQAVLKRHGWER
jgi:ankyrin repeat protein